MMVALIAGAGTAVCELMLYTPLLWRWRKIYGFIMITMVSLTSGALLTAYPTFIGAVVFIIALYRLGNLLRVYEGRLETHYLRRSALQATIWLIVAQAVFLAIATVCTWLDIRGWVLIELLGLSQLCAAIMIFVWTKAGLRAARLDKAAQAYTDTNLPTVSICIPARNETTDLEACLTSLVASNYPKLEILVLDDCSQGRTPDIIRSFAHAGVTFLQGQEPPPNWLAKNWAYQQLSLQANGDVLLFCGVDMRFKPETVRALVTQLLTNELFMLSVLPHNDLPPMRQVLSYLLQPMRYAWELSLPRQTSKHPAVLSSCWVIRKVALDKAGGFPAATQSISPESYLARQVGTSYRFVSSHDSFGLSSHKALREQWQTAVRTYYPQLHRRLELVALLSLAELAGLVGAPCIGIYALLTDQFFLAICSIAASALIGYSYVQIMSATYGKFSPRGLILAWPALLLSIYIRNHSMLRYEFSQVDWKGRAICLPALQVFDHLPKV